MSYEEEDTCIPKGNGLGIAKPCHKRLSFVGIPVCCHDLLVVQKLVNISTTSASLS